MECFTLGELMGELDKDASVIVFTFTKKLGSYVHSACGMHPHLRVVIAYCTAPVFTVSFNLKIIISNNIYYANCGKV